MKSAEEQINELKQNPKDKWIKQSVHRLSGYDKGLNDALALLKKAKGREMTDKEHDNKWWIAQIEKMMHTSERDYYYHITKGTWLRFKKRMIKEVKG